jgi:DNA polymerase-3 subunit gamma/tau
MSYLVLARKWRPQTFEQIRGQDHIVRALGNAIRSERIAHAYIFTGTRGVGKTSAARVLAKALNCVEGPTPEPCNKCAACLEIAEGKYPDVLEIDGASNNSVEDVRKLREVVRYPPVRGRYRVYIIDEVHMLSNGAFNALLKTLEEPPPHVVFIFATTDPHKIPITILSRCQQYDFKRLSVRELSALLLDVCAAEGIEIDPSGVLSIAREAEGSVRDAQSLLDQVISYAGESISYEDVRDVLGVVDRGLLMDMARAIIARDPQGVITLLGEAARFGFDVKRFSLDLMELWRDLVVMKAVDGADELTDLTIEEANDLADVIDAVEWEELHARFDMLAAGVERLRTATRPGVVLEMTLLKMAKLPPLISLFDMGAHLDKLAKGRTLPPRAERAAGSESSVPKPPAKRSAPRLVQPQATEQPPVEQPPVKQSPVAQSPVAPLKAETQPPEQPQAVDSAPEPSDSAASPSTPAGSTAATTSATASEPAHDPTSEPAPETTSEPTSEIPPLPPIEEYDSRGAPQNVSSPGQAPVAPAASRAGAPLIAQDTPPVQTPTPVPVPVEPASGREEVAEGGEASESLELKADLSAEGVWRALIEGAGPLVKKVLAEHGKPLRWDAESATLEIEVEADHAFALKPRVSELVVQLSKLSGRRARVEIKVAVGTETSVERVRRESDLARKYRTEAENHPIVRTIQDIMEGEIEGVKVLD